MTVLNASLTSMFPRQYPTEVSTGMSTEQNTDATLSGSVECLEMRCENLIVWRFDWDYIGLHLGEGRDF